MKFKKQLSFLALPLSLAILSGCGGSNPDDKIVEKAPPVTPDQVSSTPPPGIDNPTTPPLNPPDDGGEMKPMPSEPATGGESPAVIDKPIDPTATPKPE